MGGAYGEWTYRAPPSGLFPYIGRHSPASSHPMGQIYTMYIDFPLEGNTPNPRAKSLSRRPHIFRPWKALEASGDLNRLRPWKASGGPWSPWRPLGGPWRPLEGCEEIQCTLINPHIFSDLLGGPPGGGLAPSCSKSAGEGLEAGGPPGNPPKSGPFFEGGPGPLEAPGSSWRPLAAPAPSGALETLQTFWEMLLKASRQPFTA